jgi:hypothetical protein
MNHPKTPPRDANALSGTGRLRNIAARRAPRRADETLQGWKRPFDDPIPLPRGRQLVTLKDAAKYIQKLAAAEQQIAEWQAAVEAMLLVVELNGSTMVARIGVMRALNRGYVREFNSSRKDTHWGRQKLARDR